MNSTHGWKVASIRGISLKLDVSLIFLLFYVIFVAAVRFPVVARSAGIDAQLLSWTPAVWGAIFAVALLVSVVLHELGHAFTAQAAGVRVRSITLMMLGGVSAIEKIPERPLFEFKMAIIGPIVSFAIAGVLFLIRSFAASTPNLSFFCYWLGTANLALGIFNLLPAFPLDGGRALRSLLAARVGMLRGTQLAVKISKGFSFALGVISLLQFNILLALIAFFIYTAAQSELFMLLSKGLLQGMKAGEIAIRVDPIQDHSTLQHAVNQMVTSRNTVLPVITSGGTRAIVTLGQIKSVPRDYWGTTRVKDVMTETSHVLDTEETVSQALPDLMSAPASALPVEENGKIIGYIRYSNLEDLLQLKSIEEDKRSAA